MRFNSIVVTFLPFFTSIINALPMYSTSPARSQDQDSWLSHISLGQVLVNTNGFQVFPADSDKWEKIDSKYFNIVIEVFDKESPTWAEDYAIEYGKWSGKDRNPIRHSNRDAYHDIAFIVISNHIPKPGLISEQNTKAIIVRRLGPQLSTDGNWETIKEYAFANLQEFYWEKFRGWTARPIFDVKTMLSDAKRWMSREHYTPETTSERGADLKRVAVEALLQDPHVRE